MAAGTNAHLQRPHDASTAIAAIFNDRAREGKKTSSNVPSRISNETIDDENYELTEKQTQYVSRLCPVYSALVIIIIIIITAATA